MSTGCARASWSPVAAATAQSQLAGVLAGFVFAGLILLLGQSKSGPARIHTISLFTAGFLILGLDSFLFSLVSGETGEEASCPRVWSESLVASGLLGLGGVAVVGGINWLMSAYMKKGDARDVPTFGKAGNSSTRALAAIVSILLALTAHDYVDYGHAGAWAWLLAIVPAFVIAGAALGPKMLTRLRERAELSASPFRLLKSAVTLTVLYAITGTTYVGVIADVPADAWNSQGSWLIVISTILAIGMPGTRTCRSHSGWSIDAPKVAQTPRTYFGTQQNWAERCLTVICRAPLAIEMATTPPWLK